MGDYATCHQPEQKPMSTAQSVTPPPLITSGEFDELMYRLYPVSRLMLMQGGSSRSLVALTTAQWMWINATQENEDTSLFRAHMQHLERKGWFYFSDFLAEADRP